MKKMIALVLMLVLLTTVLCGCISYFTCDICGEEKFGRKYEEGMFGYDIVYCSDCKEDMEDLRDYFD